jgi:thiosulfate/3-mercaptopyruvate sulfurtransferase
MTRIERMNVATLISTTELATLLERALQNTGAPKPVILDCRFDLADPTRGAALYAESHIPGAQYVDLNRDLSSAPGNHGGRHPLPATDAAQALFRRLGISSPTTVIVYDERHAYAARCWWLLRYLGHDNVRILNGGFAAWVKAGNMTSSGSIASVVPRPLGDFTAHPRPQMLWSYAQIANAVDDEDVRATLIDSREAERYRGEREPIDRIAGHIPGAINAPWMDANSADGTLLPPSSQRARWTALLAQHAPGQKPAAVYCGSGVTACVNLLSLHLAGFGDVPLYAGSWSDWISYEDAPIAVGEE